MVQDLSLLIAFICLTKSLIALMRPDRFYTWRQGQYGSERPPALVFIVPTVALAAAGSAWYATIYHYRPWGWIVTTFLTLIALLGIANLARWSRYRTEVGSAIQQSEKRKAVDLFILALGALFLALGLFVY